MRLKISVLILSAALLMNLVFAEAQISSGALVEGAPISVNCRSAVLLEMSSGQVIFGVNADEKRPAASIVKVMTILMCLEAIDSGRVSLDDNVSVSKNASGMGGSQVLLDTGEIQTLDVLLKSTIVGSANDASVAIAEHIYGSVELFVSEMNKRAAALGMTNTHFVNCTGLPAQGQYTTAKDIARMSLEMFSHETYFKYSTIWMDSVSHGDGRVTQLTNTNRLIRFYDGCDGGKTGSTNEAGYCITATAKRGGMRLIAVVLGAPSGTERFGTAEKMLDYGFANYRLYPVAERGARVRGEMRVTGGDRDYIPLVLDGDLNLLMSKSDTADINLSPNLPESIKAPIRAGEHIGSVDVVLNGRIVSSIPVAALEAVNRRGFTNAWERAWAKWLF